MWSTTQMGKKNIVSVSYQKPKKRDLRRNWSAVPKAREARGWGVRMGGGNPWGLLMGKSLFSFENPTSFSIVCKAKEKSNDDKMMNFLGNAPLFLEVDVTVWSLRAAGFSAHRWLFSPLYPYTFISLSLKFITSIRFCVIFFW